MLSYLNKISNPFFKTDYSFAKTRKEKSIAKTTARDVWLVLSFSVIYLGYFLFFHSWSAPHSILLVGIVLLILTYLINFTPRFIYVRFLPFIIASVNIFWGSGAYGYQSQIHILYLLLYINIFLNVQRVERKTLLILFSVPILLTAILFLNDFQLFKSHVEINENTIISLSYLSQLHVLVGTILFLNIYLINNRFQKKKLLKAKRELSTLLAESEDLNKELKRSKEELSEVSIMQHKIFEKSYDAILLADSQDSSIINCNDKAVELFGFDTKEELIGKKGFSFQKRRFTEEELKSVLHQLKVEKKTLTADVEYISNKGNEFWGNLALSEIEVNNTIYHLVRVSNISEKKAYEHTINNLKNYYLTTLEYQQGLNFRFFKDNGEFRISLARGKFLENFDLTTEKAENKLLKELFNESEYSLREKSYKKAWEGESCFYEAKVPDKDIFYLVYLNPIFEKGKVKEVVGSSVDISEIKIKDRLLIEQNEELQKLNHALDRFVYSSSHDLRAPIASCLGLIDIARNENNVEVIHKYLDLKEKSLKRLDNFIGDILDYSRNNRLPVKKESINLRELVHEVFENYSYTKQFKDITKEIIIEGDIDFVSDRYRLSVVFNNLLSNAIRYYHPYKDAPYIKIEAEITSVAISE